MMSPIARAAAASNRVTGEVYLVGAGPGDPELLTLKAVRLLATAEVVVHDRLVTDEILALANPRAERISVGKQSGHHPVPQHEINDILVRLALAGRRTVRLKGGDPFIFGRGSEEMLALRAAGIACEIVPGITAAQGTAARTGVPLTHRGLATSVRYITGHCRQDAPLALDWHGLADAQTTLVVYMGAASIGGIAANLVAAGLPASTPVLAVRNATRADEQRIISDLAGIESHLADDDRDGPMLFIIGEVVSLHDHGQIRAVLREVTSPHRAFDEVYAHA
jgi:uroporphyrin-III C-methyltransferase